MVVFYGYLNELGGHRVAGSGHLVSIIMSVVSRVIMRELLSGEPV